MDLLIEQEIVTDLTFSMTVLDEFIGRTVDSNSLDVFSVCPK